MAETAGRSRGSLLVFIHIPKTAGSTLRTVLSMNEPGGRSRALGNVFKGGGGLSRGVMERMSKGQGPNLRGVGLVRGHFPLGIREYLPLYMPRGREIRCFTFLREPTERTLSHYFAVRERGGGYQLPPLPADATVEDALERGHIHDNVQTRMLSGLAEPFGEVTDEMLEQAKRNLQDLTYFGLTERFDESLALAKRRLGFRSILYRSSGRVNKTRARGDDVPAKARRAAEACNRYDIELYDYAEQLFESAPERGELDFEVDVAALRAARDADQVEPESPIPAGFGGDEGAWRMLLEERIRVQNLEWELALTAAKTATARARSRELQLETKRLKTEAARLEELEREVERLTAAAQDGEREEDAEPDEAAAEGRPAAAEDRKGKSQRPRSAPKRGQTKQERVRAKAEAKRNGSKGRERAAASDRVTESSGG
jgi:hypothetical protein